MIQFVRWWCAASWLASPLDWECLDGKLFLDETGQRWNGFDFLKSMTEAVV